MNEQSGRLWQLMGEIAGMAPADYLERFANHLRRSPATADAQQVLGGAPPTHNSNLHFALGELLRAAECRLTWEALGWSLEGVGKTSRSFAESHRTELLWTGPFVRGGLTARRIDQALYDAINAASKEVLLVTFAAAKVGRLADALIVAAERQIRTRLVLEFGEESEGQLTWDALKAFPAKLVSLVEIYYWPTEKRQRNESGRPAKLHAKAAVIDDIAIVSSANLTDDAFSRNLELGVLVRTPGFSSAIREYFDALISERVLQRWRQP